MRQWISESLARIAVLSTAVVLSCPGLFGDASSLTPSPTSLSFSYQVGAALPAVQTLAVRAGSSTASYTVTLTSPGNPGQTPLWLTATPDTGKLPASLSVRVNPTGMAVGTYPAVITLATTGTGSSSVSVPVSLVISQPLPTLNLSRTTIAITAPPLKSSTTVALSTTGGPISYTASISGAPWLSVSPASGYVLTGAPATISIAVDATSLSPQTAPYSGKITIAATGVAAASKSQTITVNLTLSSTAPAITSPLWPNSIQAGAPATTITIRGSAFYSGTTVKMSAQGSTGSPTSVTPTVLESTIMQAVIPAALLASAQTLNIVASNPGGDSLAATFTVSANPVVQAAVNLASYAVGAVSPGELITLFGAGIGPTTTAGMTDADSDGFVDTNVGGVTVTIDGVSAPLLYVSQNQISVQVPYNVTQGNGKVVSVMNGSVTSLGSVNIAPTVPAIFTLDGTGTGQAAALNAVTVNSVTTYTLNTTKNPANSGDTIILYITGEGDYASATLPKRTGYLFPTNPVSLPRMNPPPTVLIGGASATVQYAGAFAGSILGIMQLNVVVPATAVASTTAPVTVTIGGVTAQSGVTVSIH